MGREGLPRACRAWARASVSMRWCSACRSAEGTIKLQIGSTTALDNGSQVTLDAALQIVDGRTLVPTRFVGEALGAQVNWDAANRQVSIVTASH